MTFPQGESRGLRWDVRLVLTRYQLGQRGFGQIERSPKRKKAAIGLLNALT
jgi:hypothetical protein